MKTIVDNIAVEYEDQGEGPLLFMMHGWMNNLHSFDTLIGKLAGKYRVVRLDLPGFGNSEPPPGPWGVEEYAHFVQRFIAKKELKVDAFVGHSFGGRVAIKGLGAGILEAKHAILIAAAGAAERDTARLTAYKAVAKVGKAIGVFLPQDVREGLRERLYESAGSDYPSAGVLAETFRKTVGEDLTEDAKHIGIPTLLLWGSADGTTPPEEGKRLAAAIKDSAFRVYEGAGHALHRDRPREVAEAIFHYV